MGLERLFQNRSAKVDQSSDRTTASAEKAQVMEVAGFFDNYDWHADELEPGIWCSNFATDAGGEFDLFVMAKSPQVWSTP